MISTGRRKNSIKVYLLHPLHKLMHIPKVSMMMGSVQAPPPESLYTALTCVHKKYTLFIDIRYSFWLNRIL